jgi:hypothetical protein
MAIKMTIRGSLSVALCLSLGACHAIGPRQVPIDRFDYNTAVANSANEQMLLNLVRLRYTEVPVFLALNSVLTQYVWTGELGASGSSGESLNFPAWTAGGFANVRYVERPTVTYTPLNGQEFAAQLIAPVRADVVFSLVSSGWPPNQLLVMTLQRFNDAENAGSISPHSESHERSGEFSRLVELIIELAKRNAIEVIREGAPGQDGSYLELAQHADAETQSLIDEFKALTNLDRGRNHFRITRKIVGRAPDEVTIRMHSLVELMGLLSRGVDIPPEHAETNAEGAAVTGSNGRDPQLPLHVLFKSERPRDAFVAVSYGGSWFYIPRGDHASKRAFGLLTYLFQLQAPQQQGVGPLLTVPTG